MILIRLGKWFVSNDLRLYLYVILHLPSLGPHAMFHGSVVNPGVLRKLRNACIEKFHPDFFKVSY